MIQHPKIDRLCWVCRYYMADHPESQDMYKCHSCGFAVKKGLLVDIKNYISVDEVLMGRIKYEDLPSEFVANINTLVPRVNQLLQQFFTENPTVSRRDVSSGYRRPEDNAKAGGAKRSNHMTCSAVDLRDRDNKLKEWITKDILIKYDLYMEDPSRTVSWTHLQITPTRSGNRIFLP